MVAMRNCRVIHCGLVILLTYAVGCGGGSSSPTLQTNPTPAISSITPSSVAAGSSAPPVVVQGSGFLPGTAVQFNNSARTAVFVSSSQISVTLAAADLAAAGTATISLTNAA